MVRRAEMYGELLLAILDAAGDPIDGMRDFFVGGAMVLEQGDWVDPCPIGTVALEKSSSSEPLRRRVRSTFFEGWIRAWPPPRFTALGIGEPSARELAISLRRRPARRVHVEPRITAPSRWKRSARSRSPCCAPALDGLT